MRHLRRLAASCLVALLVVVTMLVPSAAAHTGFESSDPADGTMLDGPVEVVTLVFTAEAEPTGAGFEILDPSGELRQPSEASTVDGRTWVLRFDPALSGGTVGVRWMVKAPDAHPIDGSFSFTTPEAVPVDSAGDAPTLESVAAPDEAPPAADTEEAAAAIASTPLAEEATALKPPSDEGTESNPALAAEDQAAALDEFLGEGSDDGRSAQRVGAVGRFVTLVGTLLGVGGLVFAATAMRGRRSEVRHVLFWVRRAGVIVVAGALIEFVAQIALESAAGWTSVSSPSAIGSVAWSTFGIATALRLGGGFALAVGPRLDTVVASDVADPVAAMRTLVSAGSTGVGHAVGLLSEPVHASDDRPVDPGSVDRPGDQAWRIGSGSIGAAVGAAAVTGAHLFDGHTVTKGNRLLTGIVDTIHVAGGAVWAGGVVMLVSVLWRRHNEGSDLRARQLAIRFSVVASVALVVVGVAGVLLTIIVLDSPSGLWATEWGRILIAKTAFVGVAAMAGGYNHKVLIPQLDAAPDDAWLAKRFHNVVTGEALALAAVVIATAFLMGAAS